MRPTYEITIEKTLDLWYNYFIGNFTSNHIFKDGVMANQVEILTQYLKLSEEITALQNALPQKELILKNKYTAEYSTLKKELGDYLAKIEPTVKTVCSLYKNSVRYSDGILFNGSKPTHPFHGLNACESALKDGQESISFLSAVIQRTNVEVNLHEFAIRYNTVKAIYSSIDFLCKQAVSLSMESKQQEIQKLIAQRTALCKDDATLHALITQAQKSSDRLSKHYFLNSQKKIEEQFVTEITLPLAHESVQVGSLQKEILLSLLEWPLHKEGVMVIRSDGKGFDGAALCGCAVNAVMHFLFSYPSVHKRVLLCDSYSSGTITTFAGILKNENSELFFDSIDGCFVKNTDEEIRQSLSLLSKTINQRIMLLGQAHCKSILEYNHQNQDNPLPLVLVLLNGYPFKYEAVDEDLTSMLKNGRAAGVFFLITENTQQNEEQRYYRQCRTDLSKLTDNTASFEIVGGRSLLCRNNKRYALVDGKGQNVNAVLSAFKKEAGNTEDPPVYLDSIVPKESFAYSTRRQGYSKTLSIPFGKQGSTPISVELNANDDAHLAIIGTTGSGKTAFINSLILSASKLYSPDELEIHLIIMVKGDFKVFEEEKLPHLKTVVTGDRILAANDVLEFISKEMNRRKKLIGSYNNIYTYNQVSSSPLPRCLIVVDEFYQLVQGSDDAIDRITKIAQLGRAYGISLVLSSIRFPVEVNSLLPLFGNRIEFRSIENAGQLIPQAATRQNELEGVKGSCLFADGGNVRNVRVAYSGEADEMRAHIREIKSKYPHHKMDLQSNIRSKKICKEQDVPFTVKNARRSYEEEGFLRTRLGRTYLSNGALEYTFDFKNNLLFLFGHYLDTKMLEASLIKDTFVLSKSICEPTVYYIDHNKNALLRRQKTVIKQLRDEWVLSGKMVYSGSNSTEETLEEIGDLIRTREEDEDCALYPVLIVIARGDELFADDDLCQTLCDLISKGKETCVYFAIQCNEPVRFYGDEKYLNDAVIFPDRYTEGEAYSSSNLCTALEKMPAGSTEEGRKLLSNASSAALDPHLHILCVNNRLSLFVPYEYDEEYLKNIVDEGEFL